MMFKYDDNNKYHRFGKTVMIVALSLIMFVEIWWILSLISNTNVFPTPAETAGAFVDFINNGYSHQSSASIIWSSLSLFLQGFGLALLVAIPLGLFLGYSKNLNTFVTPMIEVLRPIAPIAWAPVFIYGINYNVGPVLVVFIGIFFPLLTNIIFGVKKIDPTLIDAAKTLGANKTQVFVKVMVPSAIPYLMNGIKVGLGVGWMCIVAAEMYSPVSIGVGYCLQSMCQNSLWPSVFAVLIVIAILGILTTSLAEYIQKRISKRMGME
ncbi:MAG: ABC transporter permease [Candidatus Methanomethylophilaceae archaeon]|nr:ABC transporter permease [Candidatus Methanomethylophilaceae archaeon]